MSAAATGSDAAGNPDTAPGDKREQQETMGAALRSYLIGYALSIVLTLVSFFLARSTLVWEPSIPIALSVLAITQMGVHLVFFLHITAGRDSLNNLMALAFGVLIVMLLVFGSLWIMLHLNHHMLPMEQLIHMQR